MSQTEFPFGENRPHTLHPHEHACHWPGCRVKVSPRLWGCARHWHQLPAIIRAAIWKHYVPGQEITKTPTKEYIKAAKGAHNWAMAYERTLREEVKRECERPLDA